MRAQRATLLPPETAVGAHQNAHQRPTAANVGNDGAPPPPPRRPRRRYSSAAAAQEPSALGTCNPVSILMEILATISSHVEQKPDKVQVKMDRGAAVSTLQIELEIPNMAEV